MEFLIVVAIFAIILGPILFGRLGKKGNVAQLDFRGRTQEQIKALKYFNSAGCLSGAYSDKEYEARLLEKVNEKDWKKIALETLSLDESQVAEVAPINFSCYNFYHDDARMKVLPDEQCRSSHYDIGWIFCSDTHLYMWKRTFSMVDFVETEIAKEFCLKDITSFMTMNEKKERLKKESGCLGSFIYHVTPYNVFEIVVPGDSFRCSFLSNSNVLDAIQGLRTKLREMK